METTVAGFNFFSNFDSGNLLRVEADQVKDEMPSGSVDCTPSGCTESSTGRGRKRQMSPPICSTSNLATDYAFKVWTRPDCAGTAFENGNRTWFFFGVRGDSSVFSTTSKVVIRITVMNLNKQSKLFSQGMTPIMMVVPYENPVPSYHSLPNGGWQRILEKPTFFTGVADDGGGNNFVMSFRVFCEAHTTTYLAFTYPYTYKDLQWFLNKLERKYGGLAEKSFDTLSCMPPSTIYFHRENLCYSLEKRQVDLLTITGLNGILPQREDKLDKLFPDAGTLNDKGKRLHRPFKFAADKRIVLVSARVHPGETQSSFVINGFLKFLLRETDPRSIALRKKYVFKLIPMLNPDGVVNGHYRTDVRGVNLNRVYTRPAHELHPQIYAARKLLLYAHLGKEALLENFDHDHEHDKSCKDQPCASKHEEFSYSELSEAPDSPPASNVSQPDDSSTSSLFSGVRLAAPTSSPAVVSTLGYEMTETSRFSEGDESIADFSEKPVGPTSFAAAFAQGFPSPIRRRRISSGKFPDSLLPSHYADFATPFEAENPDLVAQEENANLDFGDKFLRPTATAGSSSGTKRIAALDKNHKAVADGGKEPFKPKTGQRAAWDPKTSGLFLYVDIHGHASKRGIFMYGNHFSDVDTQASCMLLPKLMSINCANFDFPACNFTERNMYLKDRHTGAGREGSGRVAIYKLTGLIYSYTLECNFNTGRIVNGIPLASRDGGRATPPPTAASQADFLPPKYDPEIYEDAGKALATSILDMTESNPWSRLACSSCKSLRGVREWLKKHIKASKAAEQEAASEKESRSRRRSTPSESSVKCTGNSSPVRSLRSSARRHRTVSACLTATKSLRKSTPMLSPDTYRPVSKIARKSRVAGEAVRSLDFAAAATTTTTTSLNANQTGGRSAKKKNSFVRTRSDSGKRLAKGSAESPVRVPGSSLRTFRSRPSSPPSSSPSFRRSQSIGSLRSRPSSPTAGVSGFSGKSHYTCGTKRPNRKHTEPQPSQSDQQAAASKQQPKAKKGQARRLGGRKSIDDQYC